MNEKDAINKNNKQVNRHSKKKRKFNKRREIASKKPATKDDLLKLKVFFDKKYNNK